MQCGIIGSLRGGRGGGEGRGEREGEREKGETVRMDPEDILCWKINHLKRTLYIFTTFVFGIMFAFQFILKLISFSNLQLKREN